MVSLLMHGYDLSKFGIERYYVEKNVMILICDEKWGKILGSDREDVLKFIGNSWIRCGGIAVKVSDKEGKTAAYYEIGKISKI